MTNSRNSLRNPSFAAGHRNPSFAAGHRDPSSAPCITSRITRPKLVFVLGFLMTNVIIYKCVVLKSFHMHDEANSTDLANGKGTFARYRAFFLNKNISVHSGSDASTLEEWAFLKEPVTNPHSFHHVITPKATCAGHHTELVICVPISRSNFAGRETIRKTWGSYSSNINNATLLFFIGSELDAQSETQRKLAAEAKRFGDILQESYIDHYNNLSLKSVSVLKWVTQKCPDAVFILKADDDMYINVPLLIQTLRSQAASPDSPRAFVMGSVQWGARPIRSNVSKWYTPLEMFKEEKYPNYVSGTAYAMTSLAASLLFEASLRLPTFWLEDIYITGMCSRKAGVSVLNNNLFTIHKPSASGCTFRNQISGHRYSLEEIVFIHKSLYDPDTVCERASD